MIKVLLPKQLITWTTAQRLRRCGVAALQAYVDEARSQGEARP